MNTVEDVLRVLKPVQDPELRRSVVDLGMIRDVAIENHSIRLTLTLTTLACPLSDSLAEQVHHAVASLPDVDHVGINVAEMSSDEVAQLVAGLKGQVVSAGGDGRGEKTLSFSLDPKDAELPTTIARQLSPIKHLIGITSGKGGVGKSMVTGLLAATLNRMGYKVGIFDVDITGASIPQLFGVNGVRMKNSPEGIIPVCTESGIRIVSSNFMLKNPDDPVAWRGSRIAQLITDLWKDIIWGPLDYLLFDFPPGTADAQLTVMMNLPVQGLVMVTTPQELANLIVRKAMKMSVEMKIPQLGIVENMSYFECPESGVRHEIFGPSRAEEIAAKANIALLARLPIASELAQACDKGQMDTFIFEPADKMVEQIIQHVEKLGVQE